MTIRTLATAALATFLAAAPHAAQAGTKAEKSVVPFAQGKDGAVAHPGKGAKPAPKGLLNALERANANGRRGILHAIGNRSRGS